MVFTALLVYIINYYFITFVLIVQLKSVSIIWYLPTSKIKNIVNSALAAPFYHNSSFSFKLRIQEKYLCSYAYNIKVRYELLFKPSAPDINV